MRTTLAFEFQPLNLRVLLVGEIYDHLLEEIEESLFRTPQQIIFWLSIQFPLHSESPLLALGLHGCLDD